MLTEARIPDLPEWLRELYPFHTRTLQIQSCQMSFVEEGPADAPVFLLLHGNPAWSFLYRNLIPRLRERYRVIAPDHVGFGLSDKPGLAYHTLDRHISNLTCLIEALQLRNVNLVAHGWGGVIALGYAVSHTDNVARMVLTNTWGAPVPRVSELRQPMGVRIANSGRVGAWLDSLLNLTMHSFFSSRTYRTIHDLALEGYTYPVATEASRAGIAAFTRMFFNPDPVTTDRLGEISRKLKEIQAPVSLLYGERDPLLTRLPAYILRDELKGAAEPVFLPDVAHFVPEEAPDVLAETVLQQPAPSPADTDGSMFRIIG